MEAQRTCLRVWIDAQLVCVPASISVGAALASRGRVSLRHHDGRDPGSVFCGMGNCHDCLVTVDGRRNVRACLTPVVAGMRISTMRPSDDGLHDAC